ncbi:hypothetical protein B0H11DRAFT_1993657 [Mycena galericulata]|nr:hypothetical protein B0H11DRAFT_1993657 [Mycena galericulata]
MSDASDPTNPGHASHGASLVPDAARTPAVPDAPPRPTAAPLSLAPTVVISEGSSSADLNPFGPGPITPADRGKRPATPGPSVRRNAGDDFLNSLGLREVSPDKKLKVDGVQAEVRANQREIHSIAQRMARHVLVADGQWDETTSALDGLRHQLTELQSALAQHGVTQIAHNPLLLSSAIANDSLIQELAAGHNQTVSSAIAANDRITQVERSTQSVDERLARVEESIRQLQQNFLGSQQDVLDRLDRLDTHTRQVPVVPTPVAPPTASVPPPPYSGPTSMPPAAAPPPSRTILPDVALVAPSASSTEGRLLRMEGMMEQLATAASRKHARSPSPTEGARAVRPYPDVSSAAAAPRPSPVHAPTAIVTPPGIGHGAAPTMIYAPAVPNAAPVGIVHAAPPGIIPAPPVLNTVAAGITYAPASSTAGAPGFHHTPAVSHTPLPPPGIVSAPDASGGAGRRKDRPPPPPRNPAAEAYLGPWQWRQDITNEAAGMIRAVLPTHDLREAFDRAHRYGTQYVACAFKTEEQAAWFIQAFNAARVQPYHNVFASAFPFPK